MRAEIIVIENESDLAEARELVSRLATSSAAGDVGRLRAQALVLAAYEARHWPAEPATVPELLRYLMEQHDLTPADLAPILGARSRVTEILNGTRGLSLAMIRRLRDTFHIPADALIGSDHAKAA